jgi:hypothetical protein
VRGRVKFRIGRIVYLSFSRDGTVMGFAFPKEWRDALVESEPDKFSLPSQSDLRYHWVHVRLAAIDADEMRELVEDAWAFCVPKRVAQEYAASRPSYWISVSSLNMGRYIAMMMIPTMIPTPIIMSGSMIDVRLAIALSTSSS